MTALGFEFREREPPVHAASRRAIPQRARPVGQFGEETGRLMCPEHFNGRVLGDERAPRVDHCPETAGRRLDLRGEIGGRALLPASPPMNQPGDRSRAGTRGNRAEAGPKRPDHVGVERLHPPGQKSTAVPPGDGRDVRTVLPRFALDGPRPAEQVEVESGIGGEPRQQPLPEAQHAVDPLRRATVRRGGPDPARRDQLARTRQAGVAVVQPAPVGQLLGQRTGRLVGPQLLGDPHLPSARIRRCQGSSAHLPGSKRAG